VYKEEAVSKLWQSETKVLTNLGTRSDRMFAGKASGENSGMCEREQTEMWNSVRVCNSVV